MTRLAVLVALLALVFPLAASPEPAHTWRQAYWRAEHRARDLQHRLTVRVLQVRRLEQKLHARRLQGASIAPGGPTSYRTASATAYATWEGLTGCHGGACYTACGGTLDDQGFTVATNPRLGLPCGARIMVCGSRCHDATVTDRTGWSGDLEMSYALALATGQSASNWDGPHEVRWRQL